MALQKLNRTDAFGRDIFWEAIPSGGFRFWSSDRTINCGLPNKNEAEVLAIFNGSLPHRLQPKPKDDTPATCPNCGFTLPVIAKAN